MTTAADKKMIRSALKSFHPWVSTIRVSRREISAPGDPRMTSPDARLWPRNQDLFDHPPLSVMSTLSVGMVLDVWLYSGRGMYEELEDHVTVVLQKDSVDLIKDHWSKVVEIYRD